MVTRLAFVVIVAFWATMNVLLWKAEYGSRARGGSPVPVDLVWEKILSAPDDSSLNIMHRGKRVGFCRLQTDVGEELSKLEEAPKQGVVARNSIKVDGSVGIREMFRRLRFECEFSLSSEWKWERFQLRLVHRPLLLEVLATATNQAVQVHATDGEVDFRRKFGVAELQNPMALLSEVAGPVAAGLFGGWDLPLELQRGSPNEPALVWEARNDTLIIGHEPVRVYRLQTTLLQRYNIAIFVSRAGEILKAELPDGISLIHDKLTGY